VDADGNVLDWGEEGKPVPSVRFNADLPDEKDLKIFSLHDKPVRSPPFSRVCVVCFVFSPSLCDLNLCCCCWCWLVG
jgi:hypothetical protein